MSYHFIPNGLVFRPGNVKFLAFFAKIHCFGWDVNVNIGRRGSFWIGVGLVGFECRWHCRRLPQLVARSTHVHRTHRARGSRLPTANPSLSTSPAPCECCKEWRRITEVHCRLVAPVSGGSEAPFRKKVMPTPTKIEKIGQKINFPKSDEDR